MLRYVQALLGKAVAIQPNPVILAEARQPSMHWTCRYFNDVWEYDTEEHRWTCKSTAAAAGPAPRGGCQLALYGSTLFVIGGHTAWREGKQDKEKIHDDVWSLDLQTWQVCKLTFVTTCFIMYQPYSPAQASGHTSVALNATDLNSLRVGCK